jgi:hypothetical protein
MQEGMQGLVNSILKMDEICYEKQISAIFMRKKIMIQFKRKSQCTCEGSRKNESSGWDRTRKK